MPLLGAASKQRVVFSAQRAIDRTLPLGGVPSNLDIPFRNGEEADFVLPAMAALTTRVREFRRLFPEA